MTFTLSVFELQHCNNCNTLFRSIAFRDSAVSCWITPLQKNEDFFCANGINRYICGVKAMTASRPYKQKDSTVNIQQMINIRKLEAELAHLNSEANTLMAEIQQAWEELK